MLRRGPLGTHALQDVQRYPAHAHHRESAAGIRKEGSGFDLPRALGILGAYGGLNKKERLDCVFVGELSLDGGIRGVRGTLPIAIEARSRKIQKLIVPRGQRTRGRHGQRD